LPLRAWLAPLNCRGGFVLFLDEKNQKLSAAISSAPLKTNNKWINQVIREASSPHRPYALQIR
jgi:hypothetical protein